MEKTTPTFSNFHFSSTTTEIISTTAVTTTPTSSISNFYLTTTTSLRSSISDKDETKTSPSDYSTISFATEENLFTSSSTNKTKNSSFSSIMSSTTTKALLIVKDNNLKTLEIILISIGSFLFGCILVFLILFLRPLSPKVYPKVNKNIYRLKLRTNYSSNITNQMTTYV